MKRNASALVAVTGVIVIAMALLLGPLASPPEFSWFSHSTSEQAGQNVAGAWIMRAGFLAYGLGTLVAAFLDWKNRTLVRAALLVFGIGLVGAATWSNASIIPGTPSNMHEDWMHSIASGVVGFAFAAACAGRLFAPGGSTRDGLAWVGLIVSVAFPLAMDAIPDIRGLIQRVMFVTSFIFVFREFSFVDKNSAES